MTNNESCDTADLAAIKDEILQAGKVTESLVDRAVTNRLLLRLRKATWRMPDGRKAQKPSIIGKHLSDSQLLEVWGRLADAKKRGVPCYDMLAKKIQEDWKQLTDYSPWAVSRALQFYEQRIFGLLGIAESVPELQEWAKTKLASVKKIIKRVDGLEELSNAIQLQINRIESAVECEFDAETGEHTLTPFLHKEFDVLNKLLKTYMDFQLEFGIVDRQPQKLQIGPIQAGFQEQRRLIDQTVGTDQMVTAATKMLERIKNKTGDGVIDLSPEDIVEADLEKE